MTQLLNHIVELLNAFLPTIITLAVVIAVIAGVRLILDRRVLGTSDGRSRIQMTLLLVSFAGLLAIIMSLPISENTRGQLLSLIGILLSAAIALSATTFVGNLMAGMMLRAVRSFRLGDFIRCGDHFGRVSERGLFHVEIQTEYRDLTTLPNLFLVTNPVEVVRSSGTMVTAEVTLGYDISHARIRDLLQQAARDAGLEEPFVHIIDLGNFSVAYRVSGLLTEVKHLLSARSRLREAMLDSLHSGGVEIVSPTFMNTRAFQPDDNFIPTVPVAPTEAPEQEKAEAVVFDKADEAASIEKLREQLVEVIENHKATGQLLSEAETEDDKARLEADLDRLKRRQDWLTQIIDHRENEDK